MVNCMEENAVRRKLGRVAELARTQDMMFEDSAQVAETIAQTEDLRALVHDEAARYLSGAGRKVIRDSGRSAPW